MDINRLKQELAPLEGKFKVFIFNSDYPSARNIAFHLRSHGAKWWENEEKAIKIFNECVTEADRLGFCPCRNEPLFILGKEDFEKLVPVFEECHLTVVKTRHFDDDGCKKSNNF